MVKRYTADINSFVFDSCILFTFQNFFIPCVRFSLLSTYENLRLKYKFTVKKKSAVQYIITPFFLRIELTICLIRRNSPNAFEFFGCVVRLNVLKLIST